MTKDTNLDKKDVKMIKNLIENLPFSKKHGGSHFNHLGEYWSQIHAEIMQISNTAIESVRHFYF